MLSGLTRGKNLDFRTMKIGGKKKKKRMVGQHFILVMLPEENWTGQNSILYLVATRQEQNDSTVRSALNSNTFFLFLFFKEEMFTTVHSIPSLEAALLEREESAR